MKLKIAAGLLVLMTAASGYAALPLLAALDIRDAVRAGDTQILASRVDWVSVRRTLSQSLHDTGETLPDFAQSSTTPSPGLWKRATAAIMPRLTGPLIERYVTAEGAPRLYRLRQMWRRELKRPDRTVHQCQCRWPGLGSKAPVSIGV